MKKKISIFTLLLFASLMMIGPVAADVVSVTNGYYTVYVDDDFGVFTLGTGSAHPYPNTNVLYDGAWGWPGTSEFALKIYSAVGDPEIYTYDLWEYFIGVALDTNSMIETWELDPDPTIHDPLVIERKFTVYGDTYASSYLEIETTFTNNSPIVQEFGFLDMWDLMIAGSDDAIMRTINPLTSWTGDFQGWYPPMFTALEVTDITPPSNTFSIYIPFEGDGLTPTVPDEFIYGQWSSVGNWGYVPTGGDSDSGVAFIYGASEATAISLAPTESATIYQYLSTNAESFNINIPGENNVSPVAFLPLYRVKLEQALEMWECITSQLPAEISEENALLIDSVQSFMNGAITLTNPIYANGQLSMAIDQMVLIQEAFDLDCIED